MKLVFLSVLMLLLISTVYAQVDSTGVTRSIDLGIDEPYTEPAMVEGSGVRVEMSADAMVEPAIYPPSRIGSWCTFDYETLTTQEVEEIRLLEQESMQLSQEVNDLQREHQERFNELYESVIIREEFDYISGDWEEYNRRFEELQQELGITQRYERINVIQEQLQEFFDGCYIPYDEEWILFKLSDTQREQYKELQRALNDSYIEESDLYSQIQRDMNRIYEDSRNEQQQLERELGINELQEQIRELQQQINEIRSEHRDELNQVWENQRARIEELEERVGILDIRTQRENILREIQELTGNQHWYGIPRIMPASVVGEGVEMDMGIMDVTVVSNEVVPIRDNLDLTAETLPNDLEAQITTTSGSINNLQEQCELNGGNWLEEFAQCEFLEPTMCSQLGGEFNECGSACRNDPHAEFCTLQCVPYCDLSNTLLRKNLNQTDLDENLLREEDTLQEEVSQIDQRGFFSRIRNFFSLLFSN